MVQPKAIQIILVFDDDAQNKFSYIDVVGCTSINSFAEPEVETKVDFESGKELTIIKKMNYIFSVDYGEGIVLEDEQE